MTGRCDRHDKKNSDTVCSVYDDCDQSCLGEYRDCDSCDQHKGACASPDNYYSCRDPGTGFPFQYRTFLYCDETDQTGLAAAA